MQILLSDVNLTSRIAVNLSFANQKLGGVTEDPCERYHTNLSNTR